MNHHSEIGKVLTPPQLRIEIPGKVLPHLPRKSDRAGFSSILSTSSTLADDASGSSVSTVRSSSGESHQHEKSAHSNNSNEKGSDNSSHKRAQSLGSSLGSSLGFTSRSRNSSRVSLDQIPVVLWRENQRISFRAFLRTLLGDTQIAKSKAMNKFLLDEPIQLNEEEKFDEERRRDMDKMRIKEQRRFYEIARQRARELDVYMESFRREIVEASEFNSFFSPTGCDVLTVLGSQTASPNSSLRSAKKINSKISQFNIKSSPNGFALRWPPQSTISFLPKTIAPNSLRRRKRSTRWSRTPC